MTEIKPKQQFYCNKNKTKFETGEYEYIISEKNKKKYMLAKCPNSCQGKGHCRLCKKEIINEEKSNSNSGSNSSDENLVIFEKPKKTKKNKSDDKPEEKLKEVKIKKEKIKKSDDEKKTKKISKRKLALVNDENIITV